MSGLRAILMRHVPSDDGIQADILLVEPNGDEHQVRCLCKHDGSTDIGGDGEMIAFLNERFGPQTVWALSRQVTLST